jgi:hypothetical protein
MTHDMDNKEWLDEYPALKKVSESNPFTVPAGYFEELDERIISNVKLDELKTTIPADGFTLPENYFEQLSNNIKSRIAVEAVLNTDDSGFTIPENYFEQLSNNIQSRITVETALNTENPGFTVPEGYFENLTSQIQSRVFVEEVLAINKEEAFTVPANYFNELNSKILNKTVAQEAVQRKGAVIRFIRSTAFKYATAACFVLVVGASIFLWPSARNISQHDSSYLHTELSNIPVDEIQGYVELNVDANDTQHTVDEEKLPVNDADLDAALQDYVGDTK